MKSFALTLFATTAFGAIRNHQVVDLTDITQLNDSYTMQVGQTLSFQLKENPSTGFGWEIEENPDNARIRTSYKRGSTNLLGSSSVRTYTVHAKRQPGESQLVTCLLRGDEPASLEGLDEDGCLEININVISKPNMNRQPKTLLAQTAHPAIFYKITDAGDSELQSIQIKSLSRALENLEVGDVFDIYLPVNGSIGSAMRLSDKGNGILSISQPEY